jgi:uncharacterized membrane protein
VLFLIVIFIIIGFNPFGLDYKGSGEIKIKSWVEPNKVDLSGKSTVWVEVKNDGKEKKRVFISLQSYDPTVKFVDTNTQSQNESISLGRGESRRLDFKIKVLANYGGDYGINIKARYDTESIEDEVYIRVSK